MKNIGLVIIDGAADLVSDVNNMEQSTEVQELLNALVWRIKLPYIYNYTF